MAALLELVGEEEREEEKEEEKEEEEEQLYSDDSLDQRSIPDEDCNNHLLNFRWPSPTVKPNFGRL